MQGIVDGGVAPEDPIMASDNLPFLPAFQMAGVGPDLDRSPNSPSIDRVPVLVEAHQAGLGYRCRHRVEAIERADELTRPATISVKREGKYDRIVSRSFAEKNGRAA